MSDALDQEVAEGGGGSPPTSTGVLRDLVVCSLEPWDEIWRRNQFLTQILLRRNPNLRVLFVEPAISPLYALRHGRRLAFPSLRAVHAGRRLRSFRPLKPLPQRLGPLADRPLHHQVLAALRLLHDERFARLVGRGRRKAGANLCACHGGSDRGLAIARRARFRLRRLDAHALQLADEIVVCSHALAASRGRQREVSLIPNAVDVEYFRRPQPRPEDLPDSPVAIYVGTLHSARLDVDLVLEVAQALPQLRISLIGPNALDSHSQRALTSAPNITLLGPRPYRLVPGYMQHADLVIIPHRMTPFTESLDPIKAYECVAVGTPTVATRGPSRSIGCPWCTHFCGIRARTTRAALAG